MLPVRVQHSNIGSGVVGSRSSTHPVTGQTLAGKHAPVHNPGDNTGRNPVPQRAAKPSNTPPQARGRGLVGNVVSIPNVEGNRADANRSTPTANRVNYGGAPLQDLHTVSTVTNGGPGNSNAHLIEGAGSLSGKFTAGATALPHQEVEQRADNLRLTQAARTKNYGTELAKPIAGTHLDSSTPQEAIPATDLYETALHNVVTPSAPWVSWLFVLAALVAVYSFASGKASL